MKKNINPKQIPLTYWRAALAEVNLLHPEVPAESKSIAINDIGQGWQVVSAKPDLASWTTKQFASSKATSEGKSTNTIPFVLIPARLSESASHGTKPGAADISKGMSILCIPCLLDRSGHLWPDPDRIPWIPREFLEPTSNSVVIGLLDKQDEFVSSLPEKATTLEETLRIASELFEFVTGTRLTLLTEDSAEGETLPVFSLDGYQLVSEWHGIPYDPSVPARHLIKLYDQIISDKPNLPLLDNLRTTQDRPSRLPPELKDSERFYTNIVGHINREHPLSPSQREAMVELVRLDASNVLAVNGPPGTGKTTLLQSVVAQLWIDAALKESECPLILVTSTNAKAVENVIDSFSRIGSENGHTRWHPYEGGFGLFFASKSRETSYPRCTGKDDNPFSKYETTDAVEKTEKFFLEQATAWFKKEQHTVTQAVSALHRELKHHDAKLKNIIAVRYEVYRVTEQESADGAATSCQQLLNTYQKKIAKEKAASLAAEKSIVDCDNEQKTIEATYESNRAAIKDVERKWNAYLTNSPVWLDLLTFIPPIKKRRMARDRLFLISIPMTEHLQHRDDGVQENFNSLRKIELERKVSSLASLIARRNSFKEKKQTSIKRLRHAEQSWKKINEVFSRWQKALLGGYENMLDVSLTNLNDSLDTKIRAAMFRTTDWYWSGRWLLEMRARLDCKEIDTKGRTRLEAKYRRFSKLSPCIVSNFHMAPSFFTAWEGSDIPFWNAIDLMIVDEAGQVSPDVGSPMFALAKRALVVGDTYQIEPVWNNAEGTDRMNAVKFGLIEQPRDPHYNQLASTGYSPASGNLMQIANRSCAVQKYDDIRGLMLTEHRRCVPELVDYCNKLVYSGRLEPKRPSISASNRILPAFGHMNVTSEDKKVGASRQNYEEAKAIVGWLKSHRSMIEKHYAGKSNKEVLLWELVGIVTPFASQAGAIERQLRKDMPDLMRKDSRLTVGTVHKLQGAERAIVIFSPTYGASFNGGAFFDKKPNMLNVAVSRAKDSFLVIGNLSHFNSNKSNRPSGVLGSYLFHPDTGAALSSEAVLYNISPISKLEIAL